MPNEQQLSDVLREFAHTMVTDFPIQAILDHLVERIVDVLPITAAGVTVISPRADPHYVAASDESALRYEELQTELAEGPCLMAYQTGEAVAVGDLRTDGRFPTFGPQAAQAGLAAVFTFPLRDGDRQLGALDLYRDAPGLLSVEAMTAAQILADVAAAYLRNAQIRADLQDSSDRSREAALHDPLTGLPNRVLMLERLEHAFQRGRRSGMAPVVLFADLDGFKAVNDHHGHGTGDELLVAVARRITEVLRPGDTLARLSGDEFVILCEDLKSPDQAAAIGLRLHAALSRPFVLSNAEVDMTASVGIAAAQQNDNSPESLLHDADTAMYQAKRRGGARHQVLDLAQQDLADRQALLERDLCGAEDRAELHLEYQPIVDSADGRITGVEALLRWAHPTRGLIPPSVLIPLAEQIGRIAEIGRWVLAQAWADRKRWPGSSRSMELGLSVNVSAHQLMVAGFSAEVAAVLRSSHTDARLLTLEITESAFVRVFIADLRRHSASHFIADAVVRLAHNLGMTVVAEGVETLEQHDRVRALGCDSCQGYYFARPMSPTSLNTVIHPGPKGHPPSLPPLPRATPT